MADLLDRTATQVRRIKGPIHKLVRTEQSADGRVYSTRCGDVLSNVGGAVLTTRDVTCLDCAPISCRPMRPRELYDAVPTEQTGKGNAAASGSPGQVGGDRA